ncbi:23S rRNA (adenine(2503)-C(2))-methyltransferase RlmN [Marinicella litoralis]|uniref:Dual-specificity RNA methyltransferase RlmN n=1 Tax=Marinicella litoralis TaxID=644220 RepID=A0A4R6XCA4_9GAMM|nr:23S rRNA (adenine(2503)-C(2))-methyltransferase RlmN [Marinicella litoralis]TDR16846.1 23S rRNA m(2)A-2503 methyltransferase [Marinicella litoralis]
MKNEAINLLNLDRAGLESLFLELGEQRFRAAQALKWIYGDFELDFAAFNNFSLSLREKLAATYRLEVPELLSEQISIDGTKKWLLKVDEVNAVETVFIPEKNRGTLCVSSQVGCTLNCTFCATGAQGFNRHLTTAEIVAQVWVAAKHLGHTKNNRVITNVVMMGMGEPLANYSNVLPALNIMRDDLGFGFANRRVTVSTAGLVPKILQLNEDADVSLAISLHSPFDELRNKLVPLNKKYNIKTLLDSCKTFIKDKRKSRITIEYTLIDGVNDQPEHARALCKLLSDLPSKINLIPFNPFPGTLFKQSKPEAIETFKRICMKNGFISTVRKTRGDDIDAACGQLAGEFMDRTRRSTQVNKLQLELV